MYLTLEFADGSEAFTAIFNDDTMSSAYVSLDKILFSHIAFLIYFVRH